MTGKKKLEAAPKVSKGKTRNGVNAFVKSKKNDKESEIPNKQWEEWRIITWISGQPGNHQKFILELNKKRTSGARVNALLEYIETLPRGT